jgi:hypothetical protein
LHRLSLSPHSRLLFAAGLCSLVDGHALATPAASQSGATPADAATSDKQGAAAEPVVPANLSPGAQGSERVRTKARPSLPPGNPGHFARFDKLRQPLLTTRYPGAADTVTGDAGGWRSWLADHSASMEIQTSTIFSTDLRGTGAPSNPQVYNGQKPTLQVHATNFRLSVGFDQYGLGDTRINAVGGYLRTSFDPNGPDQASFRDLSIYHGFHNRTVEIEAGFIENFQRYAGLFGGGNPILTTGLGSLIPIQAGLSAEPAPTPGFNISYNGKKGFYARAGVSRSENPLGLEQEVRKQGSGLDWSQKGARALYIGEIGIRREASPDQRGLWLRMGYIHNTSRYQRLLGDGTTGNHAFYLLGDYQLTRPDPQQFFRGLYIGGSYASAPKTVNVYTRSGEARAYYIGPIASRPTDAVNLTITYNGFSSDYHQASRPLGRDTERYQVGASVSYAIQVIHGIHVTPALQYLMHPTVEPGYRNALIGALSTYILW